MSLFMFIHYLFEVFALVNKDTQWYILLGSKIVLCTNACMLMLWIPFFPTWRHLQNCIQILLISTWNYWYSNDFWRILNEKGRTLCSTICGCSSVLFGSLQSVMESDVPPILLSYFPVIHALSPTFRFVHDAPNNLPYNCYEPWAH